MTKLQWGRCADRNAMLRALAGRASDRKFRLFSCACCRRVWHLLQDESSREAVRIAEAFADDNATEADLRAAFDAVFDFVAGASRYFADEAALNAAGNTCWFDFPKAACQRAESAALHAAEAACGVRVERGRTIPPIRAAQASFNAERHAQVALLHCVFGGPERPGVANRDWLTEDVLKMARSVYAKSHFADLPILADALQDAGCANTAILGHLRDPGPHVRGCWALDLVLGLT